MEQNYFKLCMIETSHEQYMWMLLSVTFDIYPGHRVSTKFKWAILISQELSNKMVFGMQVSNIKYTSPASVLFVNFAFKAR